MTIQKWRIISEEDVSPSKWFPLSRHVVELPNGKRLNDYFLARLGNVAMIVPVTEKGEFILVKQYKHGIGEITLEFPAGLIENGQEPIDAAHAELEQETGIVTDKMIFLGELWTLPSKSSSRLYGFFATDVKITKPQQLDISEEIEVVTIAANEMNEKIISGEINCSDTLALFTLYKAKRKLNLKSAP
jgi:8-oxo-dGTP pyrophosphatase MutT (NUDIX family)